MNYKYSTLALAVVALLTGCGAEDNKSIGDDNNIYPPIVKGDVTIPALHVGLTAQGAYQYFDPNPAARPEGNSKYSWRDANEAELSSKKTLELTYDLLGESVQFCITPVAQGSNTTVGEEECSNARPVLEALGEKPVAVDVNLSGDAAVGKTLSGTYRYTHPDGTDQGASSFVWYAGTVKIAGEENQTLVLTPQNSEGKKIKFCVIPVTQEANPVRGDEVCTSASNVVVMAPGNVVPTAVVDSITGSAVEGAKLTGEYTWTDVDDDVKAPSIYSWKRGTDIIDGARAISYTTINDDVTHKLSFCVQPFAATGVPEAGVLECLTMTDSIAANDEIPPTATPVTIDDLNNGIFEVGDELLGNYVYDQKENITEGLSTARWKIGADVTNCTEGSAASCNYTLATADLGKDVQFCVTPVTANKKEGTEACSAVGVQSSGIKLTGTLEYDKQLFAESVGYTYTGTGEWRVDTISPVGLISDLVQAPTLQAEGLTYTIGVREGTLTDLAWVARPDGLDARNFIGKSVQFCLDTTVGERCVSAADFSKVTGGVYFKEEDSSMRGIEPVRMYAFGSSTYHRSLTLAESNPKNQAGFGDNISTAQSSTLINGIQWATFAHDAAGEKDVLNVCRNLYADIADNGEWYVPIGYMSSSATYLNNIYSKDEGYNNIPPEIGSESLNNLAKKIITSTYTSKDTNTNPAKNIYMSRVFGWPTSTDDLKVTDTTPRVTYASATKYKSGKHTGKSYSIRLYNFGSSSGNSEMNVPQFVSCVK